MAIKIPSTPPNAYDPNRPANALLLAQVRELAHAVRTAGRKVQQMNPRTEADVAMCIRHLNRALHHQILLPALKRKPVRTPLRARPAKPARKRPPKRGRRR